MQPASTSFERLERTVTLIAHHARYPGKLEAIADCLQDIDDRWERGQLTLQQRFRLYAILLAGVGLRRHDRAIAV
jgi:hypothetical protein